MIVKLFLVLCCLWWSDISLYLKCQNKSIFKDENKPNQNTPAHPPPPIAASKAIAAIGLERLMLQLLLIACIVSKYCTYGEVPLRCDSESNQFSRIWMRVACSLCVCGIECCPSKQWVLSGSEHTGLLCSASGVAVPPPCSRPWRGWVEFWSQVFAERRLGISDLVLTSVLLSSRDFFFWARLHLVKHKCVSMWKGSTY